MNNILISIGAAILGGIIGFAFGALQRRALLRHTKRQEEGNLVSGWALTPASTGRVAVLLVTLAAVQAALPMFFQGRGTPWLVSAGVVIGYGLASLHRIRRRPVGPPPPFPP
jgi:hypothetical protein